MSETPDGSEHGQQMRLGRYRRARAECLHSECGYRTEGRLDIVDDRVDGHISETGHMVHIRPVEMYNTDDAGGEHQ